MALSANTLARAHGAFNVGSGLWPLLHMPSFELVSGPKADRWLVRTVAGLLVGNGAVQLSAPGSVAAWLSSIASGPAPPDGAVE